MKQNEGKQKKPNIIKYTKRKKEKTISNWMLKRRKCSFNIYEKEEVSSNFFLSPWKLPSANSLVLFKLIKKLCNFVFLSHYVLFFVLLFFFVVVGMIQLFNVLFTADLLCYAWEKIILGLLKSFLLLNSILYSTLKESKESKKKNYR